MAARANGTKTRSPRSAKPRFIRHAVRRDGANIIAMMKRAHTNPPAFASGNLLGRSTTFPEGQFVVEWERRIAGEP